MPHEQYISHNDHSVEGDLENLMLQEIPSVDFQSGQNAPIVYENALKKNINKYNHGQHTLQYLKAIDMTTYLPSISLNRGSNSI